MEIRKANIRDIEKLKEIGKQTFYETFSSENSEENMAEYLENGFSTEKLKSELTDQNAEFYFAELDGKAIGYLKVNVGVSQTEIKGCARNRTDLCFKRISWKESRTNSL